MVGANLLAQQLLLNPIFLVADPMQTWRLAANFLPYLLPFLAGAGVCGLLLLAAMWWLPPQALGIPSLAVSEYKGVSCARKFPDCQRPLLDHSPFGQLEV